MDTDTDETITARQTRIIEIVRQQGFATIDTLARDFGVSAQSVRRDVIKLDAQGVLQRFHGGVGIREASVRLGYTEKREVAAEAKRSIAREVASLVPSGSVVFLDVGTTVEATAAALADKQKLRVFTASLPAAGILAGHPGIELFVLGGLVRGVDGSLVGETTLATISRFRFDYAILGFSGIDHDGVLMDYDLEKVAVKQAAVDRSAHVLAVGDSSKFRKSAVVRFANIPGASIVTEASPPPHLGETIASHYRVIVAKA